MPGKEALPLVCVYLGAFVLQHLSCCRIFFGTVSGYVFSCAVVQCDIAYKEQAIYLLLSCLQTMFQIASTCSMKTTVLNKKAVFFAKGGTTSAVDSYVMS